MTTRLWDRAAVLPSVAGERIPEVAALPPELPTLEQLFTFMRDAELRFATLRMRIEERAFGARGELLTIMDISLRRPGDARVVTSEPGPGAIGQSELWISDGTTVRTYSTIHRLGTSRPVRNRPRGLDSRDFPGSAKVYEPVTPLPNETLADLFIHPGGYCQNVLSTGRCWVSGSEVIAGREAIVVDCDHPRAVELYVDRPDYHVQLGVDRETGVITRLVESVEGQITRLAEVVHLDPDARLAPATFEFEFPDDATMLY
jgi:outer membrane lipoprotein-sorting protein